MNNKYDGPLVSAFESDVTGVVKQELITYRIKNGMLQKETTQRRYQQARQSRRLHASCSYCKVYQ